MIEIIVLVIAVTGIATLARGRGASPVVVGTAAVAGWALIEYGGLFFLRRPDASWPLMLVAWAWIALVAGYVRFVVGAGHPKPDSQWNCSHCRYLNNASAVICEACQQPWKQQEPGAR
jgi:hypothetical protein